MNRKAYFFGILLAASIPLVEAAKGQSFSPQLLRSPINPDFVRTTAPGAILMSQPPALIGGRALGFIPPPLDLSHLRSSQFRSSMLQAEPLPAVYDLRTLGRVTPVRDQGSCGSCWSFATFASLESSLTPGGSWNFSENNLKNRHGFDNSPCAGGNYDMAGAYLARWSGAVLEAADPYQPTDVDSSPPLTTSVAHVEDIEILPGRTGALDNDLIKRTVMAQGAVSVSMYFDGNYYNDSETAYYYSCSGCPSPAGSNHGVAIVGWDDNFDRNRFKSVPPGNGAFLIKNSWGTWFGDNGCFYISYYDAVLGIGTMRSYPATGAATNFDRVYQYDELGWIVSYGYSRDHAHFSNVFTPQGPETLKAVSFQISAYNSPYTIRVYTGVSSTPTTGSLLLTQSGVVATPGYHTVRFSTPVQLSAGSKFSVAVQLQTPGYNYPIPVEAAYAGYSSQATAHPGESYISADGVNWSDLTSWVPTGNVCLKAFTTTSLAAITVATSPPGRSVSVDGVAYISPQSFSWSVGTAHTIATDAIQQGSSERYVFAGWSDNGAQSHIISASSSATYTAGFVVQYPVVVSSSPAGGGSVVGSPSSTDGYYSTGSQIQLTAVPSTGYQFVGWTGSFGGTANPHALTVTASVATNANFAITNDEFVGAIRVPSVPSSITEDTGPATDGTGDPVHSCTGTPNFGSVWFQYAATFSGTLRIDTDGSGFATVLAAYPDADSLGAELACNAGVPGVAKASISLEVVSGFSYLIEVTGLSPSDLGSLILHLNSPSLAFVPVTPCRIADTRNQQSGLVNGTRDFAVLSGNCGIPTSALAYVMNVTAVPQGRLGYLTVWPSGQPRPLASTLNSLDGRIRANAAIVPAGAGGSISVYTSDPSNVVLDINGYFVPAATAGSYRYFPVQPCRLLDTRKPSGAPTLGAGQPRQVAVVGNCTIPAGAEAYSLNFTVVPRTVLGYLTVWQSGAGRPLASTLNAPTGAITPNAAIVPAGPDGSISVYSSNDTDLVVDVNGYFASNPGGLSYYALAPCRVADTRWPVGALGGPLLYGTREFPVSQSSCRAPQAEAYSLNATVVPSTSLGFLTLWPAFEAMPVVSTLNSLDGAVAANAAIVRSSAGWIATSASDPANLVLDVNGYFAP